MKLFILILFGLISIYANELQWVDEQIDAIKPPRSGLASTVLLSLKDPFVFLNKPEIKTTPIKKIVIPQKKVIHKHKKYKKRVTPIKVYYKSRYLTLNAIMNSSALINTQWYKVGEKVGSFKLTSISPTSVVLMKKAVKLILSTKSQIKTLNFKSNQE